MRIDLCLIAQCSALMPLWKEILGDYTVSLDTLSDIHWFLLLKFAKASKRFYQPRGLSGLRTGPMKWPQRWVGTYVVTLAVVKVKVLGFGGHQLVNPGLRNTPQVCIP